MRAELDWQPSLLDGGTAVPDVSFTGLRRIVLDEHSWVDYGPGWLDGSDEVFEQLTAQARWQQRTVPMYDKQVLEPRLTAGWSTDASDADTPRVLTDMAAVLSRRYEVGFDRIWVNLYRSGADSVAWHGDRNGKAQQNPFVVTISLGGRRLFQLRRKGTTLTTHRFTPGQGDLIVMGGACQHDWEHCVPKTKRPVHPRMSVTIRHSAGVPIPLPEIPPSEEW